MIRLLSILIFGLSLVLAGASCKKDPPQTVAVAVQTSAPAGNSGLPPLDPPTEPPKPAEAKPKEEDLGDAYTANKTHNEGDRANDAVYERSLQSLRPKQHEYVELDGTKIDVNFKGIKLAPKGAHLNDLTFELTDGAHSATTTMTDKKRDVAMKVGLGWCGVKVKPFISVGKVSAIGTGHYMNRAERVGHYEITLLDDKGKAMGGAQITEDRRLVSGFSAKGYECWMRRDPEWEDEQIYNLARVTGDKSTTTILQMRWVDKAMTHHQVEDSTGNIFMYAFPTGQLELIKPEK